MNTSNRHYSISYILYYLVLILSTFVFSGCGSSGSGVSVTQADITKSNSDGHVFETNVLIPEAPGTSVIGNDYFSLDYSNSSEGYIVIKYTGESERVKFQITGNNQVTYTYNLTNDLETVIPLSSDSGLYNFTLYECIGGDQFSMAFTDDIDITITNQFGPFLYPNQYVNFSSDTLAIKKAADVVKDATCELEAVSLVYEFVVDNVTYDHEEAETVASNYLPDVDEVMSSGKGICFDYAALMASMLRSQGIPTRLEIGYAKDAYHAWISVYTPDQGWIGGVIQFDGTAWTLMDPTLASNSKDVSKIKNFIGDGSSYTTKYIY